MPVIWTFLICVLQTETGAAAANKNLTGAQVCLSVGVIRACGLKVRIEQWINS